MKTSAALLHAVWDGTTDELPHKTCGVAVNGEPAQSMMLALPIATAGVMLAMAAGMRRAPRRLVRWTGVIFSLGVVAYALKLWNDQVQILPEIMSFPRLVLGIGTVGWFWLFVIALFEDADQIRPGPAAAVVSLTLAGLVAAYAAEPYHGWLQLSARLGHIGMMLHALFIIARGWKGDLVEPRRRLRGPFLVSVAGYILVLRGVEILGDIGIAPSWFVVMNVAVLFLICLAGSLVFLESRGELFGATAAPSGAGGARGNSQCLDSDASVRAAQPDDMFLDRAAKADLDRLQALMKTQQIWREEGLTIASLAARASMPEAQLRRLINGQLGYRNFPSFVNAHRIAAAKARLGDPDEARTPVSAIAFDLGFGSLGPFNRAFREETGASPSEWRRKALGLPERERQPGAEKT